MSTKDDCTVSSLASLPEPGEYPGACPPGADLTAKQRSFASELFKLQDKTAAYMVAYPATKNRKNAANEGRKLARNPRVLKFIEALRLRIIDLSAISVAQVEIGLARIAFADPRRLYDAEDNLLPVSQWPDDVALAVSTFSDDAYMDGARLTRRTRKVRLSDRLGALRTLAEIKAMLNAKPDTTQRTTFTFNFGRPPPKPSAPKVVGGRVIDQPADGGTPLPLPQVVQ